jgi:hypothetical protein
VLKLIAGFTHVQRGTAHYRGVLRVTPKAVPSWTCPCVPSHLTAEAAVRCARSELERRQQGGRQVFVLLHCERCSEAGGSCWWDDVPGRSLPCPRCGVPLLRLKLAVLERSPVS